VDELSVKNIKTQDLIRGNSLESKTDKEKKEDISLAISSNTRSDELKNSIKEYFEKYRGSTYLSANGDAIMRRVESATSVQELEKIMNELNNSSNSKVSASRQSDGSYKNLNTGGDCHLLAAINTYKDRNGGLAGILADNGNGYTVTFQNSGAAYSVRPKDAKNRLEEFLQNFTMGIKALTVGNTQKLQNTDEPIKISLDEIKKQAYQFKDGREIQLSSGDADVKILEIAYYKLLEKNGVQGKQYIEGQKSNVGMQLLHKNTKTYFRKASKNVVESASLSNIASQFKGECGLETLSLRARSSGVVNFCFSSLNNEDFKKILEAKKDILIKNGADAEEVEKALKHLLNVPRGSMNGRDGMTTKVPTKDGQWINIFGQHAYTLKGCSDGYVTLINPHDSSKTFEIPDVYMRLLAEDLTLEC